MGSFKAWWCNLTTQMSNTFTLETRTSEGNTTHFLNGSLFPVHFQVKTSIVQYSCVRINSEKMIPCDAWKKLKCGKVRMDKLSKWKINEQLPRALRLTTMPSTRGITMPNLPTAPCKRILKSPVFRGWMKIKGTSFSSKPDLQHYE